MRAPDRLAEPLVRQHLGLTNLIANILQALYNLREARPASLADLFELFLKPGIIDINIIA